MSNFALYMIGTGIVTAGLAWAAYLLGAPPLWIGIGALICLGISIVSAVGRTRYKEASPDDAGTRRIVLDEE